MWSARRPGVSGLAGPRRLLRGSRLLRGRGRLLRPGSVAGSWWPWSSWPSPSSSPSTWPRPSSCAAVLRGAFTEAASLIRSAPRISRRNLPVWLAGTPATSSGRALGDDETAAGAALGAHVDDPVGGLDHVEVVLDDDDRVAHVDQAGEHVEQLADVVEVQTGGRLVQDVDRAAGGALLQLGGELDALGLAAGEGGRGLAEPDVAEADVVERLEVAGDRGDGLEEVRAPPRSACSGRRRWTCPCSGPPGSRGCSGRRGRPRTGRRRPAGSSSRS